MSNGNTLEVVSPTGQRWAIGTDASGRPTATEVETPLYLLEEVRPFLLAIAANPDDDLPRLVYADWLEESRRDDQSAATVEFVRISCRSKKSSHMPQAAYRWLRENWKRLIPKAWEEAVNDAATLLDSAQGRRPNWFECAEPVFHGRSVRFRVYLTRNHRYGRRVSQLNIPGFTPVTEQYSLNRGTGYRAEIHFKRGFAFAGQVYSDALNSWTSYVNFHQPFCNWPAIGGAFSGRCAAFETKSRDW